MDPLIQSMRKLLVDIVDQAGPLRLLDHRRHQFLYGKHVVKGERTHNLYQTLLAQQVDQGFLLAKDVYYVGWDILARVPDISNALLGVRAEVEGEDDDGSFILELTMLNALIFRHENNLEIFQLA